MCALTEEHTGRTVKLRYDNSLGSVDDESTAFGHVGNRAEVDVLDFGSKVLVIRVGTAQLKLSLERHTIRIPAFETFFDAVARRVDVVVEELESEIIAGVRNWEVFCKHLVKPLVSTLFRRSVELEKVSERLKLHFQKVRIRKGILYRSKVNTGFIYRN